MLRFYKGRPLREGRLGVFPGAFNPPTRAHLALARAARDQHRLDQVVFLLPATFPHKSFMGAPFEDRLAMLEAAVAEEPLLAVASSDLGLFIDIAREFRSACGPDVALYLLCGKDAAERIVRWDYGSGPSFAAQLEEFHLLVASRHGNYQIPPALAGRIELIKLRDSWDECSASSIRRAIAEGGDWLKWVPPAVGRYIEAGHLYSPDAKP